MITDKAWKFIEILLLKIYKYFKEDMINIELSDYSK